MIIKSIMQFYLLRFVYSAVLSIVIFCPSGSAFGDLPETILKIKPSIVAVGTVLDTRRPPSKFRGTGFAVGNGNLIITNAHVIPDEIEIAEKERLVVFVEGDRRQYSRKAEIVEMDSQHDLALLKIEGTALPAMTIAKSKTVLEGKTYAFTGFPIGTVLGHYPVTHQGIVSAITPIAIPAQKSGDLSIKTIRRLRSPYNVFQLDAIAYPGNSGSPLYDPATGHVVGVVNSVFVKETKEAVLEKPSGISYAIPAKYVQALLEQYQNR
jgi:serine protease Do